MGEDAPMLVLEKFNARHATYGGWIVSIDRPSSRDQREEAAFTTFDEMLIWLKRQVRKDAGANRSESE